MRKTDLLYAAYGSNLHLGQMAVRCPTAEAAEAGVILGRELLFRGRRHNAVATIEPQEDGQVPVLLWWLQERDVQALDHYEGFPYFYRKEMVQVQTEAGERSAMAYIMNDGYAFGAPSDSYLQTILEGYRATDFDTGVLEQAVDKSIRLATQEQQQEGRNHGFDLHW